MASPIRIIFLNRQNLSELTSSAAVTERFKRLKNVYQNFSDNLGFDHPPPYDDGTNLDKTEVDPHQREHYISATWTYIRILQDDFEIWSAEVKSGVLTTFITGSVTRSVQKNSRKRL